MNTLPTTMPVTVPLYRLAHGRTGDKGNRSNISLIAWNAACWPVLVEQITEERVAAHFAARRPARVQRFVLQRLQAMNWVLDARSEEHTSELQSPCNIVCRLLLEKKKRQYT